MGYYNNPEATAEALRDRWLYSGDAGYFDDDGHLIVIDRAKDVMTLHDGTKCSPQFIENKLKFSPYVKEAVVFGGDWPFVTAMINIDFGNVGKWAESNQSSYTTYTDLAQKAAVYALVRQDVELANAHLPPAAQIQRFILMYKELDADDAELTRTRKVRRGYVAQRYEEIVSALYGDQDMLDVKTTITYQDVVPHSSAPHCELNNSTRTVRNQPIRHRRHLRSVLNNSSTYAQPRNLRTGKTRLNRTGF